VTDAEAKLRDMHRTLDECMCALLGIREGGLHHNCLTDTAFALGEALGTILKAKALVGRDIDELGATGA